MNLIIPGLARTGTRSLWKFFKEHPEVITSKVKEPLRINNNLDNYFNNFNITESTKFIFDGTPELTNYPIIHQLGRLPEIKRIYQIWFTRNPVNRIKSMINRLNKLSDVDLLTLPRYVLDIDMKSQLVKARCILGGENVFVSDIYKGVERQIEDFLKITKTTLKISWDKH